MKNLSILLAVVHLLFLYSPSPFLFALQIHSILLFYYSTNLLYSLFYFTASILYAIMNSNFSSENPALNYFKYSPQEKWDFSSYEKNVLESDNNYPRATKSRMLSKYKHCLNMILNCSGITDDQKQTINNLLEAAVSRTSFS